MKHLKVKIDKYEISGKEILKDIEFILNAKDKIALVWGNGVGKSTLMKILTKDIKEYDWNIENIGNMTLGYLTQIYSDNEEKTVREELRDWFGEIIKLEQEIKRVETEMETDKNNMNLIESYTSLLERFNNIWWYNYNNQIHNVSNGMWILDLLEKKLVEISWGQRTKVALAKILLESPDILLLDEPTNFIDLHSVEWLENYLQNRWKWWYFIISHDREFLDKSCQITYEMEPVRPLNIYHNNYSWYVLERGRREKKLLEEWDRQQEYIDKEEKLINRFRAGSRASWAKSRGKALDKLEKIEKPYIPKKPKFFFEYSQESNEKLFYFREAFIGREEPLFFIHELSLYKWQRIWLIWENWVGKSTLLKTMMDKIDLLDWTINRWKWMDISYYSQLHEELDKEKNIIENFETHWLHYAEEQLIWLLSHYLIPKDNLRTKIKNLSGWQISKVAFAILGQKESNLLILDEPTNHLDYDTRESLESSLSKYPGTILFISHDRYFVNKLSTHTWIIRDWELFLSYGNYKDYIYKQERGIDLDMALFDEEAELNLVLEEKLWEKAMRKVKKKFK